MIYERPDDFLDHSGVKDMKWGVRKQRTPGVSRKTDRDARGVRNLATGNTRYVGTAVLAGALAFKGGQAAGVFPTNAQIADKAIKAGRSGYEAVVKSGAMRRMMHEINIYNGRRKFNRQFG